MTILKETVNCLVDAKVIDIKIYETKNITPFFDYAIVATANSSRQLSAVVARLRKDSQEKNIIIRGIEGLDGGYWALVDMKEVIVNIFIEEEREKYDLDKLWRTLPQISVAELV